MQENLRVIFIDVDEVLNTLTSAFLVNKGIYPPDVEYGTSTMDHGCVQLFRALCKETKSMFVLSSTWRKNKNKDFIKTLEWCGFTDWKEYYLGDTPILDTIRGEEIKSFLTDHPNIKNYVIIDDNSDMLDEQLPHFVKVNGDIGFTVYDYIKAVSILKRRL